MGKIFPMEPLAVRMARVRKREKEARRAAEAPERASAQAAAGSAPLQRSPAVAAKPARSHLERHNCRRKREAKRKAEARRLKGDMAVSAAVKDLLKGIRETVALIDRIPKDELGRVRAYDVTEDGEEITSFEKTSCMFERFTSDERHALSIIARKHRAAAKRLAASIATARGTCKATLAEYKRNELIGSSTKAGGQA